MKHRFEGLRHQLGCLVHGHRLPSAPVYAEVLPDEKHDEELHYCEACGRAVWVTVPHEVPDYQRWTDATAI